MSEVVCGIGFEKLEGYTTPYMGLFWSTVIKEFPIAETLAPLPPVTPGVTVAVSDTPPPPPAPRYFLRSQDRDQIIQLQEDRFLFNWVRTESNRDYPRYSRIITQFRKHWRRFERFSSQNNFPKPIPKELRLTYVNHIIQDEGWNTLADIGRIFPDYRYRQTKRSYLKPPTGIHIAASHPVKDPSSRLDVSIQSATRNVGESGEVKRMLILQLSVVGNSPGSSSSEVQRWFDMAREAIDLCFVDLTSQKVQLKQWGRHDHN